MKLVYKFINRHGNERLLSLCRTSKDLYNQALHACLQALNCEEKRYVSYIDLDRMMKTTENLEGKINYRLLKAQVAQQTLKAVSNNMASFFRSIKEWKKHPEKYKGMPRPPRYLRKNGYFQLAYTNQCASIRDGFVRLDKDLCIPIPQWGKYGDRLSSFQQVRVLPKDGYTEVEIVYTTEDCDESGLDYGRYASIDLGLGNFAALVTDFSEPLLYSGKQPKAHNQLYNKRLSEARSKLETENGRKSSSYTKRLASKRNARINDIMHKVSRDIVRRLAEEGVGNLVCGRNKGWKDSISLGKVNNQNFVQIPYERFIGMLRYKCGMCGIVFHEVEESYTSKCDALAMEVICKHEGYKGKRKKRGLFQSSVGKLVNADVNGALNIMRKVVGDSEYIARIVDRGLLFRPRRLGNLYNVHGERQIPERER